MITETKAKLMVCPILSPSDLRQSLRPCIGSKCMMWRELTPQPKKRPDGPLGYCGMGGKP